MKKFFVYLLFICSFLSTVQAQYNGSSYPQSLFDKAKAGDGYINAGWPEIGVKADGKTDDLIALRYAINFCLANKYNLQLPNGIVRVTDQVIAGYKCVDDSDMLANKFNKTPSYNLTQHNNIIYTSQFKIKGSGYTVLYADFNPSTPKSVLFFGLKGNKNVRTNIEQENAEIRDLVICTKSYIDSISGKPYPILNSHATNKLIGISSVLGWGLEIKNVVVHGLDKGFILNECPRMAIEDCYFQWCNEALNFVYSEHSRVQNATFYFCKTAMNVRSTGCKIDNGVFEFCGQAIIVNANDNIFTDCYLESNINYSTGAQLTVGQNPGENGYHPSNVVTGTEFHGLRFAIPGASDRALGIEFKETARTVQFFSGVGLSIGLVTYINAATRAVVYDFQSSNFPTAILRKIIPN